MEETMQLTFFDTTEQKDDFFVAKSNRLINEAKSALTAKENVLLNYLISMVKPNDESLNTHTFTINELNTACNFSPSGGGEAKKDTLDTIKSLTNRQWYWRSDYSQANSSEEYMRWIGQLKIMDDNIVTIKLDESIAPHVLNLIKQKNYTQFPFQQIKKLKKSINAQTVYERLYSVKYRFDDDPNYILQVSVKEIREWMGMEEINGEPKWAKVTQALNRAIELINKRTDMHIEKKVIRESRQAAFIAFKLTFKKPENEILEVGEAVVKDKLADEFEEIWSLYPKQSGKSTALLAYRKARQTGTSFDQVREGILNYRQYLKVTEMEAKYIHTGENYFKKQMWNEIFKINFDFGKRVEQLPNFEEEASQLMPYSREEWTQKYNRYKDDLSDTGQMMMELLKQDYETFIAEFYQG